MDRTKGFISQVEGMGDRQLLTSTMPSKGTRVSRSHYSVLNTAVAGELLRTVTWHVGKRTWVLGVDPLHCPLQHLQSRSLQLMDYFVCNSVLVQ